MTPRQKKVVATTAAVGAVSVLAIWLARRRTGRGPWDFVAPLDVTDVIQGWGEARTYRCPKDETGACISIPIHEGIDFKAKIGTKVYAIGDGVVVVADNVINTISGRNIAIRHAFGLHSSYVHLDRLVVHVGQRVKAGQLIGYSGNTGVRKDGKTFDPHLHMTIRATPEALKLYERAYGKPKSGWGGRMGDLGRAVPGEPVIPARYPKGVVQRALARGVYAPKQLAA